MNQKYVYDEDFIRFLVEKGYRGFHISQITGIPVLNLNSFLRKIDLRIKNTPWCVTPNQLEILKQKYADGNTTVKLSHEFDCSSKSLSVILRGSGVELKTYGSYELAKTLLPEDHQIVVDDYLSGRTFEYLGKLYRCSATTIHRIITKSGVKIRSRAKSMNIYNGTDYNLAAFSNFDIDEHSSYFYGLLLADGFIRNNTVTINLHSKDIHILKDLTVFIGCKPPRLCNSFDKRNGNTYTKASVTFSNELLASRLREQGLEQRKSCKEKLPLFDWINNRHFWRGVFDGDGHINSKNATIVLVGSKEIVEGFIAFCENHINFQTQRYPKVSSGELFRVLITGDDARKVASLLYKDCSVFLTRKKLVSEKYKEQLNANKYTDSKSKI